MLVPDPTSSDDKDTAGAVLMWSEVLTLATVSLWVCRRFELCHGAVDSMSAPVHRDGFGDGA